MVSDKKLITLDEWNEKVRKEVERIEQERLNKAKNGIACPECSTELIDAGLIIIESGNIMSVSCLGCGYRGTRKTLPVPFPQDIAAQMNPRKTAEEDFRERIKK
jgi:Zn ribbon nucleic-acid-binding protein